MRGTGGGVGVRLGSTEEFQAGTSVKIRGLENETLEGCTASFGEGERSVPTVRMPQRNIPSEFWATEERPVRHHHPQLQRLRILALTI